jgi:hypothetical protein
MPTMGGRTGAERMGLASLALLVMLPETNKQTETGKTLNIKSVVKDLEDISLLSTEF